METSQAPCLQHVIAKTLSQHLQHKHPMELYRDGVMTSSHVVVICPEPSRLLPIHMVGMQSFQMSLDCRERVQMTLLACSNDFRIFTATEDTNKDQYVREQEFL